MRFTRLVIEADQSAVSLALHPHLTVVAGVDPRVRAGLAQELIGGLGGDRPGVHLELVDDADRHLAVFRPTGGAHRVIDVDQGVDVSDEFRSAEGHIDLLGHHGIVGSQAEQLLHLDRSKLAADTHRDEIVNRLAELDQTALWSCAGRVRITEDELTALTETMPLADEDDDAVARIEQRHLSIEVAVLQQQQLRRSTALVALTSLLAAAAVAAVRPVMAIPLAVIGVATVLLTFVLRARLDAARRSEQAALADVGADSYLGFVVQRVDGMFSDSEQRRRLAALADDHRTAAVRWTRLAGDVSVEWALEHHDDIRATARLRHQLRSLGHVSATAPELDEETADIAHALMAHLGKLRRVGPSGESFPLVLDDPFTAVPQATKLSLLELLARRGGSQVILLTEQEDVASWARLEALTGDVALIEPFSEPVASTHAELAG